MNQGKCITIIVIFIVMLLLSGLINGQADAGICPTPPCVDSTDIIDFTIKAVDIASGAVNNYKLLNDAVTGAKILNGSITGGDIQDGSITGVDISSGSSLTLGSLSVTGNVGVGIMTTNAKLDIQSSSGASDILYARMSTGSGFFNIREDVNNYPKFYLAGVDGNISVFIPASGPAYFNNGNVGIGTVSPLYPLHISKSNANDAVAKIVNTASDGYGINIRNGNDTRYALAISNSSDTAQNITMNGSGNAYFAGNIIVDGNINAKYQDVAEWVPASIPIPSGTVVILDLEHSNRVTSSFNAYDTRVAGVVSDTPGILLGESGEGKVRVATTGRVKVKVDASHLPIRVGDLLVTGDKEGMAMRSEPLDFGGIPIHRPGTILGKALETFSEGTGEILVLLTLQ